MTAHQLIGSDWRKWIEYIVGHNPRAVFNWIQANYKNPLPNWAQGFEASSGNQLVMRQFLEKKAETAANTAEYLVTLYKSIPANS